MRTNIFYWKCDSPIPVEQKKNCFFFDKYTEKTQNAVADAVRDFFGHEPDSLEIMKSDGNHLTARIVDGNDQFLFRADEGAATDDCYMLAESTVMNLLHKNGLPVPEVFKTDISLEKYPFRFQIMQFVQFPCLNKFAREHTLDELKIAEQSGEFLARVHALHFPRYGFFNTDLLAAGKPLEGLENSAADYFNRRLDDHLAYLAGHELVDRAKEERIRAAFQKAMILLEDQPGSLLHRDYAYWNILGSADRIEMVIDWDDCISGDPADDFGIVNCFLAPELLERMLESYSRFVRIDDSFRTRIQLHTLRNMLWKTMIRDYMGYFDKGKDFFLSRDDGISLKEYTLNKIDTELEILEHSV